MSARLMQLKVLLPGKVLLDISDVRRIVVDTTAGAYGLLPRRLDCSAAVAAGILTCETAGGDEFFVAHDAGVMVKHGQQVLIAVRGAFIGTELALMQQQLSEQYLEQSAAEHAQRQMQARLESGFVRRFANFRHE